MQDSMRVSSCDWMTRTRDLIEGRASADRLSQPNSADSFALAVVAHPAIVATPSRLERSNVSARTAAAEGAVQMIIEGARHTMCRIGRVYPAISLPRAPAHGASKGRF